MTTEGRAMSDMKDNISVKIKELYADLEIERDEIKLKLGLMKLEVREQWEKTESQWQSFKNKAGVIEESVEKASVDVGHGLTELGKEIKHAYKDIKKGIKASNLTK